MANFNNYNSTIGNQVIGTLNIAHNSHQDIHQKLDTLFQQALLTTKDNALANQKVIEALNALKLETTNKIPNKNKMLRIVSTLGSIAGIGSFAEDIYQYIASIFN